MLTSQSRVWEEMLAFVMDFVSTTCGSGWVVTSIHEPLTDPPATAGGTDLATNFKFIGQQ